MHANTVSTCGRGKGCGGGSYRRRPSALANEYFIKKYFFTLGILIEL